MDRRRFYQSVVLALVTFLMLGGVSGLAAAQEEDCGVDGCLEEPDDSPTVVVPGGGVAFDTPVVDTTGVMPGDRVTPNDDFRAFLKAKKAFHEARQSIQAIEKGEENPVEDVPSFFDDEDE